VCLDPGFLTAKPQVVRVRRHTSRPLTLNTGSPRVVSSAPYCTPCTHTHVARSSSNTIVKFVVVGLISGNDKKAYLEEFANLSLWCQDNSLMLNVPKTKDLVVNTTTSEDLHTTGD